MAGTVVPGQGRAEQGGWSGQQVAASAATLHTADKVVAAVPNRPRSSHSAPLQADEIMTCGCFASGHANAELALSSGCCRAGEGLGARLQVVNRTKKPFKSVKVQ